MNIVTKQKTIQLLSLTLTLECSCLSKNSSNHWKVNHWNLHFVQDIKGLLGRQTLEKVRQQKVSSISVFMQILWFACAGQRRSAIRAVGGGSSKICAPGLPRINQWLNYLYRCFIGVVFNSDWDLQISTVVKISGPFFLKSRQFPLFQTWKKLFMHLWKSIYIIVIRCIWAWVRLVAIA